MARFRIIRDQTIPTMSEKQPTEENVENVEEIQEESTEVDEQEEESTEEPEVDYDGELEIRQNKRDHNKKGYEMRKGSDKPSDDEEKESNEEMMRRVIREERLTDQKSYSHDVLSTELGKITNESERKLVEDYYNNTIRQSGTSSEAIISDIALAQILANRPRVNRENKELKVALKNREGMSKGDGGSNQDKAKSQTSKWSKEQLADFAKRGVTAEQVEANLNKKS